MDQVRVRFAPSPTGHLHIGGARTAIYNWAFARRHGGDFILRIDDTDPERSTDENTQAILRAMEWLGLDWDEGPGAGGDFGPYFQTQRSELYAQGLVTLQANDAVYPCFCTADELKGRREAAREAGGFAGYDRRCRTIDKEEAAARIARGDEHVWRLAVPLERDDVTFVDAIRGETAFPIGSLDDFILVRSDGTPTYNFATVVDDVAMEISHVVRGDDHLSNTPRQILVFEALGGEVPTFAHLSMIWGADGKRLSKRHGATSVEAYRDLGYLPEAILNYLTLLGWSLDDKTTMIDRDTLVENFSFERVSKNPAVFDTDKLEWMNGVYIREMPVEEFADRMSALLTAQGMLTGAEAEERREWLLKLAPLVSERIKRMDEIPSMVGFFFSDTVEFDDKARKKVLDKAGAGCAMDAVEAVLKGLDTFETESIEAALRDVPEALDLKPRIVFQAVRVALSGSMVSPPLFESIDLLGKEKTLQRLRQARSSATD